MRDPQELSVGKFLQQERERKNITLEAVSQVTRISVKNLEAIENDDFISLPAPIFIRSFLKVYAAHIGLNPDKVIALYETQTGVIGLPPAKGFQPEKEAPDGLKHQILAETPAHVLIQAMRATFRFMEKSSYSRVR